MSVNDGRTERERMFQIIQLKKKDWRYMKAECYARPPEDRVEYWENIAKLDAEIQDLKDSLKHP